MSRTTLCIGQPPGFFLLLSPLKYKEIEFKVIGPQIQADWQAVLHSSKMTLYFSLTFFFFLFFSYFFEWGSSRSWKDSSWYREFSSLLWSFHQVCAFWKSVSQCDAAAATHEENWENWLHPYLFDSSEHEVDSLKGLLMVSLGPVDWLDLVG